MIRAWSIGIVRSTRITYEPTTEPSPRALQRGQTISKPPEAFPISR
jgi:hypothetical protein